MHQSQSNGFLDRDFVALQSATQDNLSLVVCTLEAALVLFGESKSIKGLSDALGGQLLYIPLLVFTERQ